MKASTEKKLRRSCQQCSEKFLLEAFNEASRQLGRKAITAEAARHAGKPLLIQLIVDQIRATGKASGNIHQIDPLGLYTISVEVNHEKS